MCIRICIINVYLYIFFYSQKSRQSSPSASHPSTHQRNPSTPDHRRAALIKYDLLDTIYADVQNYYYRLKWLIYHYYIYRTQFKHFEEEREI